MPASKTTLTEDLQTLIAEEGQSLVDSFAVISQATDTVVVVTMTFQPDGTASADFKATPHQEVLN